MKKMGLAVGAALAIAGSAQAATIAQWTFDSTDFGTLVNGTTGVTTNPSLNGVAPEVSNDSTITPTLSDVHTANTKFYQGNGNGSAHGLFNDHWSQGNYYEVDANLSNYTAVSFSIDAAGSATGPRDFQIGVSTDGTTFTDVPGATYSVADSTNFATATANPAFTHSFDLSAYSNIVAIRVTNSSTTSISGATTGTSGTSRVDNITISGTPATNTPEPASLGLAAIGGLALARRRRA